MKPNPAMVNAAKEIATHWHGEQAHGCLPISEHLLEVTEKFKANFARVCLIGWAPEIYYQGLAAAWLHDTLEDTDMKLNFIDTVFGYEVGDIVSRLTDVKTVGNSRTSRHIRTYHAIRQNDMAVYIKMCDRWHNQKRTIENKELKYANDYYNEYCYFKFALYEPNKFVKFWEELDDQYILLAGLVKKEPADILIAI